MMDPFKLLDEVSRPFSFTGDEVEDASRGSEEKYRLLYNYQAFILKLTDSLRPLTDAVEIQNVAARAVGELMKVGRAFYFEAEEDTTGFIHVIKKDYHNQPGMVSMVGRHPNSAFGELLLDNLVKGRTLPIGDVEKVSELTDADKASYRQIDCRAYMAVPLIKNGQYKGGFAVLHTEPRIWTASEAAVLEEVAERTWAAVVRGRAEERLAEELQDAKLLQQISNRLIQENDIRELYNALLDSAMQLMNADFASIQLFVPEANELLLLLYKNFHPDSAKHLQYVRSPDSTSCGQALKNGSRVVVEDIDNCPFEMDKVDYDAYCLSGIVSMQSTPLVSRTGNHVGMISTYWREVHRPSGHELNLFDVLARQAADLIERRQSEEALQKSEEKYRAIFNSINEGFSLLDIQFDENGKAIDIIIRDANEAQDRVDGVRAMIGKRVRQFLPELEIKWIERYAAIARSGKPESFEDWSGANQRWYDVHASRVGGDGSTLVAIVYNDITERKRQERHQEYLLKLSEVLRSTHDAEEIQEQAAATLGEQLNVSRAFYYFIEREQDEYIYVARKDFYRDPKMQSLVGRYPQSVFGRRLLEELPNGVTLAVPDIMMVPVMTPEELERYLALEVQSLVVVPLIKDGKYIGGFVVQDPLPRDWTSEEIAFIEETTEKTWLAVERAKAEDTLRKNEQRLSQLLKLRDEFIGIASHELKTPLTSIKAYGQVLERHFGEASDDPYAGMMRKLNLQVDRLIGLITDMLDTTRVEEGKLVLSISQFDLNELIREKVEELQRISTIHTIVTDLPSIPPINADRERIGQVLTNLISNAVKYSPDGGEVLLTSNLIAGSVRVSVRDQGMGIPADALGNVFDRFYRVDSREMRGVSGMGLGLFISQDIVQRHGGSLTAESEYGKGANFTFILPVQ